MDKNEKIGLTAVMFFFIMFLGGMGYFFYRCGKYETAQDIANLASAGCPKSKDMNREFQKLYDKFGNGKKVPYVFENGTVIDWNKIYFNIDFLISERELTSSDKFVCIPINGYLKIKEKIDEIVKETEVK
jgi:hypothetical protein